MVSPDNVSPRRRSRRLAGLAPGGNSSEEKCKTQDLGSKVQTDQGITAVNTPLSKHVSVRLDRNKTSGTRQRSRLDSRKDKLPQKGGRRLRVRRGKSSGGKFQLQKESGMGTEKGQSSREETLEVAGPSGLQGRPLLAHSRSVDINLSDSEQSETGLTSGSSGEPSSSREYPALPCCGYRGLASSIAVPVKGESFCDCPKNGRDLQCTCGEEEDAALEWQWDAKMKSPATELSPDGRDVRFHVTYSSGTAAARGTQPMVDSQHFWEIKMTTPVYGTDMMVGVGTPDVDMNSYRYKFCSMLGRDADSWGLSYLGRIHNKGRSRHYAPRFGQGTIIGVHLDMWHGTLAFYKNRKPLGIAYTGLNGKVLHPMVSSTAARSGMRIIKACSFHTSLQFLCCQVLRRIIPPNLGVIEALGTLPPGLKAFLTNNLGWLLRSSELEQDRGSQRSRCESLECAISSSQAQEKQPGEEKCGGQCQLLSKQACHSSLGSSHIDAQPSTSGLAEREGTDLPTRFTYAVFRSSQRKMIQKDRRPCDHSQPQPSTSSTSSMQNVPRGNEQRKPSKRAFPNSEAESSDATDSLHETKKKKS